MDEELLTIEDVTRLLENDAETVRKWIARGLPIEDGPVGTTLIRRSELDAFLEREGQGRSRDAATED